MKKLFSSIRKSLSFLFSSDYPLEKRITYAMVICAMGGELIGTIESLALKLAPAAIILPLVSFILHFAVSFWGRKIKSSSSFAFLAIFVSAVIIFPLMFFANAGLEGGMPFYFIICIVSAAFALRGKRRLILFILLLFEYTGLFLTYHYFPNFFIPMSPENAFIDQLCSLIITCTILFLFSYIVSKQNFWDRKKIKELSELYEHQANTDELTGLCNRRSFNNFLKLAILTLGDTEKLHLSMFDIDDFKKVNDTYGHPYGDFVLKDFADILKARENDGITACRYGGEEFLLLIPKKNKNDALAIVENIIEEVRKKITLPDGSYITASAGFITCTEENSYDSVLKNVDDNLYKAKCAGKNRVVF